MLSHQTSPQNEPESLPLEKRSPEELDAIAADLIAEWLKIARRELVVSMLFHHPDLWEQQEEYIMEKHKSRAARIDRFFFQKKTGLPF